ncbi:MAG: sarcosine oxidase subunit gamma [Hyphomicrobiales bacterium]
MADPTVAPRPALADVLVAGRYGRIEGPPGLIVSERTGLSLASIIPRKGQSGALAALVKSAYGFDLPATPRLGGGPMPDGRSITFIWAGLDQWLAVTEGMENVERELTAALGKRAMIADQSDGRCVLRLRGPKAREVLAKGVAVDLHPRVFKTGDVALTTVAHLGVQLWQLDEAPTFEIAVFRSLAGSFWSWLAASAAEFGYLVVAEGR